ncbi:MAG: DUF2079 domain-containing protein [Sandaracinaceae bacterium]|nr:DUF2079 domain-containing protein [Sandaracinaceae bacterium]
MEASVPPPAVRRALVALVAAQGVLFAALGLARYASFHNETFDLAFYARIAWGLARNDHWEPLVDAHVYGLHLSPILIPLGALGAVTDTAAVLLVAQAAALALAAFPLARIGVRHLGAPGALVGALVWLFHPNLGHVAGYEAHPGVIAALPLAWIAWAVDAGSARALVFGALGVLLCREDLALGVVAAAALFAWRHAAGRRAGAAVALVALAYVLYFFVVLHPRHAPPQGSLQLHFGHFGDSLPAVLTHVATHPGELVAHLAAPERLLYLPKILAPLALLPLLAPRWVLPALPALAVNLLSAWPTATDLDVQYLTPALPFLVAGALEGAGRMARSAPRAAPAALAIAALTGHVVAGGTPLSLDHPSEAMRPDHRTAAARAIAQHIPPRASVQAPYPLLAHLAERPFLRRTTSPESGTDYYVLDVAHRRRFAANEDLVRTTEEPPVRDWLARDDHRLVYAGGDYLLLERGYPPRSGLGGHAIVGRADPEAGEPLTACLALLGGTLREDVLELRFVARARCPSDLALRVGVTERPRRTDLLFGGWLSPVHLERGDLVASRHRLGRALRAAAERGELRVGLIRQSGARPEPDDPNSVRVPL